MEKENGPPNPLSTKKKKPAENFAKLTHESKTICPESK